MAKQRNRRLIVAGIASLVVLGANAVYATCPSTPDVTCKFALGASLAYSDKTPDDKDKLSFKLTKGANTPLSDFGDPTLADSYDVCIYGYDALLHTLSVPADGDCSDGACWVQKNKGSTFKDKGATQDGVAALSLGTSTDGSDKTKINLKAKGSGLPDLSLPLALPITVQVRNSLGKCWGAIFTDVTQDAEAGKLKAKMKSEVLPTCSDIEQNGYETDFNCGGGCAACGFKKRCQVNGDCMTGICRAHTCQAKRVFVTSSSVNGAFGGLAQADNICNSVGSAIVGTSWVAWLSTSSVNALDRITDQMYQMTNGDSAFAGKAQISSTGRPDDVVKFNQNGQPVTGNTWTGTSNNGTAITVNCNDWTSNSSAVDGTVGDPNSIGLWSTAGFSHCNALNHLICFEQ